MASVNGGELLVKALESEGPQKIFSIPGGQLVGVYESIRKSRTLELVVPRQEGAGALMACGYALAREKPAVMISTAGAGVIYEIDGLTYAWRNRIPLISIAPQVQSWRIKPIQDNLQAVNQDEFYEGITKFHCILYHPYRIPQLVRRAYRMATAAEPGPVHLDLPVDIAFQKTRVKSLKAGEIMPEPEKTRFIGKALPDPEEVKKAAGLISGCKRPVALVGGLMARLSAAQALEKFLAEFKIPALNSDAAFSAPSKKSALCAGTAELFQDRQSLELLRSADLFLYFEPDEQIASLARKLAPDPGRPAIQFSSYAPMLHSVAPIFVALTGSPEAALEQLAKGIKFKMDEEREKWLARLKGNRDQSLALEKNLLPEHRVRALEKAFESVSRNLSEKDFVVCEGRDITLAAKLFLQNYGPARAILIPDTAPSGAGFPLALGIKAAAKDAKVFLVSDRKNFKKHCREFQTASRYKFGICSLVFPDQDELAPTEPNLARLSESLGVRGVAVQEPVEEINEVMLGRGFELESGMLLEIRGF